MYINDGAKRHPDDATRHAMQTNRDDKHTQIDTAIRQHCNRTCIFIIYRFAGLRFTSSSLHACNISLFGWPGVMPEWPFDQSYDTAYAKIVPVRLKHVVGMGPGAGSNATHHEA